MTGTNSKDPLLGLNHLTPIRWVLALMVVVGHSWFVTTGYEPIRLHQWSASYMAVNGFFILSGLLITKSLVLGKSKVNFILARVLRIMPAFAVVLLAYAVFIGPFYTAPQGQTLGFFDYLGYSVRTFMMLDPEATPGLIFPNGVIHAFNGALWTIRFEVIAYIMAAGLVWTGIVRSPLTAAGICLGLTICYFIAPHYTDSGSIIALLRLTSAFSIGIALWYIPALRRLNWMTVGLAVMLFLAFGWFRFGEAMANIAMAAIIMKFGLPTRVSTTVLKLPDWSYGIYLWHYPVMQVLLAGNPQLNAWQIFFLSLPITLVLAALSWNLVEKTSLRLKSVRISLPFLAKAKA